MPNRRFVILAAICLTALSVQSARAQAPAVLKNVPADFQVVIVIKSMAGVQQQVTALTTKMGLADQLGDLTKMLGESRGLNFDQIDRDKPLVLMIPAVPTEEPAKLHGAMLLPVKDFKAFIADNKIQPKGDENIITTARGVPLVTRPLGDYALLADNAKIADQITKPDQSLANVLSADELELWTASQVFVHVNVGPAFEALRPRLEKELRSAGEENAVRSVMELVQLLGKDCQALDLGLAVTDEGVEVRGLLLAKDKSPMAEAFSKAVKPAGSLVTGVPLDNFLVAGGWRPTIPADSEFSQRFSDLLKKSTGNAMGDAEQASRLLESKQKLVKLIKSVSFSIAAGAAADKVSLPLVATLVAEVSDGAAAQKASHEYLTELTKLKFPSGEGAPAPAMTLVKDADVAGVGVEKLVAKPELVLPALGEEAQLIPKVFGDEELAVRVAVRNNMLVVTVGGKAEAMQAAFKAIDDKIDGQNDPGITKVKSHLVAQPATVMYLAVDRLANVALGVFAGLAGVALPEFPKVAEPMVLSAGFKEHTASMRLFVPAPLLVSGGKLWGQMRQLREGGPTTGRD